MAKLGSWWSRLIVPVTILVIITVSLGAFGWYKFFREVPQPPFASMEEEFMYGSMGSEGDRGLPYWIWLVLPRIFPEYLPGPGGYKSLGVVWEEGKELPAGFAKKTVGFPRVTNNCAACHTATFRTKEDETPTVVPTGPSHTSNIQNYLRFLTKAAEDPRFIADVLLREIALVHDLPWIDRQLYRYLIIPFTKSAILQQRDQFAWMERKDWPHWGPGRDDPMNLTKYFMTDLPLDNSTGNADFPSIWNLKWREGQSMNWAGETLSSRAVLIDSALGLGMPPTKAWVKWVERLDDWLKQVAPPKFPFPINKPLAAQGRLVYEGACASCHEMGSEFVGTVIYIDKIGTDRERLDTWTQEAADQANEVVWSFGIKRENMIKTKGYVAQPLDGIWLRAPYLHNGSVPSIRDLLKPEAQRPTVFYRGYDVYNPTDVGFVSQGPEAQQQGWRLDTSIRGDSSKGHRYGTDLPANQKNALIEYLKTL